MELQRIIVEAKAVAREEECALMDVCLGTGPVDLAQTDPGRWKESRKELPSRGLVVQQPHPSTV